MMKIKLCSWTTLLNYLALISVVLGLSLTLFYQSRSVSSIYAGTCATFQRLKGVPPSYAIYKAWSPRVASIQASYHFVEMIDKLFTSAGSQATFSQRVQYAVAFWTAGWFVAICIVYILAFKMRSLFFMLGTFAGIIFGYTPELDFRIYSWDMPALFFFAVATSMLATMKMNRINTLCLAAIIICAIPFKETSIVLCIFPLIACHQYSLLRRLVLMGAIAVAGIAIKHILNYFVTGSLFSFAVNSFNTDESLFMWNMKVFFREPVILVNAGTLFAMLVIPVWQRTVVLFKIVACLFIISNFIFGVINEYRIWFELIPLSLATLNFSMCSKDD